MIMKKENALKKNLLLAGGCGISALSRRKFLGFAGVASGIAFMAACKKDNTNEDGINLGSGDIGILNYANALEQLEAAFYIQVLTTPY